MKNNTHTFRILSPCWCFSCVLLLLDNELCVLVCSNKLVPARIFLEYFYLNETILVAYNWHRESIYTMSRYKYYKFVLPEGE